MGRKWAVAKHQMRQYDNYLCYFCSPQRELSDHRPQISYLVATFPRWENFRISWAPSSSTPPWTKVIREVQKDCPIKLIIVKGCHFKYTLHPTGSHPGEPGEAVRGDWVVRDVGGQAAADRGLHEEDFHWSDQGMDGISMNHYRQIHIKRRPRDIVKCFFASCWLGFLASCNQTPYPF